METVKEAANRIVNYCLQTPLGDGNDVQVGLESFESGANWQKEQDKAIIEEFEKMKKEFYVNICRAYNAGKQNMGETINDEKKFISSHAYFVNEFPEFKNYIP